MCKLKKKSYQTVARRVCPALFSSVVFCKPQRRGSRGRMIMCRLAPPPLSLSLSVCLLCICSALPRRLCTMRRSKPRPALFGSIMHYVPFIVLAMNPTGIYRVEQKKWSQVERKFLPGCSQPQPATPGWCLAKQFFFSAQICTVHSKKIFTRFPSLTVTYCAHLLFYLSGKRKPCKSFFGMDCTE